MEVGKMAAHEKWLARLDENAQATSAGVRFSFTLYVYPNGQGSLYSLKAKSKTIDEPGFRFGNVVALLDAVRAAWEAASSYPK